MWCNYYDDNIAMDDRDLLYGFRSKPAVVSVMYTSVIHRIRIQIYRSPCPDVTVSAIIPTDTLPNMIRYT